MKTLLLILFTPFFAIGVAFILFLVSPLGWNWMFDNLEDGKTYFKIIILLMIVVPLIIMGYLLKITH